MIFAPQAKLLWHGDRVREWLMTGDTSPILIEIAPTGYCNAKCKWCFFKDRHTSARIDTNVMLQALRDIQSLGVKAINWSGGGEPTLHPDFDKFVALADNLGLKQGLFTNAFQQIPLQDSFSWIRISLTDSGFKNINVPIVAFGVCLNQTRDHLFDDIALLVEEARDLGARYFQVRPALEHNYKDQPRLPVFSGLTKLNTDRFEVIISDYKYSESIRAKHYPDCYGYHFCPSIDWNGKLCACLYMSDCDHYVFGDINKTRLTELWGTIPAKLEVISWCQNCCKNHEINKLLYAAKNVDAESFL